MTKLLVSNGLDVIIIDLESSDGGGSCISNPLPPLPKKLWSSMGYLHNFETPIICGADPINCICFALINNQWSKSANYSHCHILNSPLGSHLPMPPHNDAILSMQNLQDKKSTLQSLNAITGKTKAFSDHKPFIGNCLAKINSTFIVSVGGQSLIDYETSDTSFLDLTNNQWTDGPQPKYKHFYQPCGTLNFRNETSGGTEEVVVAVGQKVEVLTVGQLDRGWVEGPALPFKVGGAKLVECNYNIGNKFPNKLNNNNNNSDINKDNNNDSQNKNNHKYNNNNNNFSSKFNNTNNNSNNNNNNQNKFNSNEINKDSNNDSKNKKNNKFISNNSNNIDITIKESHIDNNKNNNRNKNNDNNNKNNNRNKNNNYNNNKIILIAKNRKLYQLTSSLGPWIELETNQPIKIETEIAFLIPNKIVPCK
jgi:hypothetical protein